MTDIDWDYTEKDGILYADVQISNNPEDDEPLGLYGQMALKYLREEHPVRAMTLSMEGTLMGIMHKVENEALERKETLIQQMLEKDPMPAPEDTLGRARHMNALNDAAEEIVLKEIVYKVR